MDQFRDFAGQATGEGDEPLMMGSQEFFIDAGFVVIAFEVGIRNELDEIFVTGFVFGEKDEVMVDIAAAAGSGFFLVPAARGDVDLATEDGLHALVAGGLVKIDGAIKNAVVGEGDGRELQIMRLLHELVEAASAIQ